MSSSRLTARQLLMRPQLPIHIDWVVLISEPEPDVAIVGADSVNNAVKMNTNVHFFIALSSQSPEGLPML